ncbi:MAG: aspartate aminotransferase family protein [Parasporobacterium sp.]|nr:aspartate aminotransferase family protein [Parasporobacterium sp.]
MGSSLWMPLARAETHGHKISRGRGVYLYDTEGRKYIDANSGLWNVSLGYAEENIMSAVKEQMERLYYVNPCEFTTETAERLADTLLSLLPEGMSRCLFTCSGSESIETAVKIIRRYQILKGHYTRDTIAVIKHSYHGNFYGGMSASSYERHTAKGYGPLLEGFAEISVPFDRECSPDRIMDTYGSLMYEELNRIEASLAGVIIEPVLGSAGVIPIPVEWMDRLMEYCRSRDIPVVSDEVATGFGRTGRMFVSGRLDNPPDIITMSKGINNGILPFGAAAVSDKIEKAFLKANEPLFHLSTQNCNPVCCAAASELIRLLTYNDEAVLDRAEGTGGYLEEQFGKQLKSCRIFHSIRRAGLMIAIELKNLQGGFLSSYELFSLKENIKRNGVILEWAWVNRVTSCLVLFPMFITGKEECDTILSVVSGEIRKLARRMGG